MGFERIDRTSDRIRELPLGSDRRSDMRETFGFWFVIGATAMAVLQVVLAEMPPRHHRDR